MIKRITHEYEAPAIIDYGLWQWDDGCVRTSFDTEGGTEIVDDDGGDDINFD